jgi:hypothetical protein
VGVAGVWSIFCFVSWETDLPLHIVPWDWKFQGISQYNWFQGIYSTVCSKLYDYVYISKLECTGHAKRTNRNKTQ